MTEDKEKPQELTDEELDRMVAAKEHIKHGFPRVIAVGGKTYTVRQVSKKVRERIHTLELEAYALSGKQKESMPLRKAKKIQRKLDTLHAKTAAYYLLGNKALFVPFLFALTWRKLMLRYEEHTASINNAALNDEEVGFSLANWENTKHQLALSMKPIGDGVRETLKRWRAAEAQAAEDATKKKAEDSK
mgnify:FL=1|jgi:hypothetical protein